MCMKFCCRRLVVCSPAIPCAYISQMLCPPLTPLFRQENWKLLIYDAFCRDIISTLFKVADLRKHGVTLHLNLNADRQQVQDVSAIYMCTPSRENVDRIGKDCAAGLYDSMHLNWSSSITQEQLLALATAVAESDSAQRVAKVFDQHFHFISLDHRLFSLQMPDSYIRLNDPEVGDAEMESTMNDIVSGLFSALVTLGVVPVIRCPRGDAAGMVRRYPLLSLSFPSPPSLLVSCLHLFSVFFAFPLCIVRKQKLVLLLSFPMNQYSFIS